MDNKSSNTNKNEDTNPYRFGIGIELIDNNILSGPDIERAVNRQMIGNESTDIVENSEDEKNS